LKNKNIDNIELNLLSCIKFENLEEIDLSYNKISDFELLKDFNMPKIKKLDLSFNKLNFDQNFNNNKIVGINYHKCKYCEIKKRRQKHNRLNSSKKIKTILSKDFIKLDGNDLLDKDIEEIKNHIINYHESNNFENDKNSSLLTGKNKKTKDNKKDLVISLLSKLEVKVKNFFNVKLKLNLKGKEIKLDLNNKNIGNIELNLLSCIEFKDLEEINLSHNNISNIEPLKDFNMPKLKKLDISFNKINNISSFKEISKKINKIECINISNNSIKNVEILKTNILPFVKEINLDNNNIIKKDIEEIKEIIIQKKNNNISNLKNLNYNINNDIKTLLLNFMDSKNINDTNIRNTFMDFIIKIFDMNMLMSYNMYMFMNNYMNMFMNNNNNMFMNNNMNMFMNNNMNMFMNNNNNMFMNNNNMFENLNNQTNFFEHMYDRFIINDKDNYNNIEKADIYNNFLNFIDYLKINDINLYSQFINLRNNFIFNINSNNINSNLSVKKEVPINIDFYKNDAKEKINFIFQTSNRFKIILPTPLDVTFNKLIKNFENAFKSRVSNFDSYSNFDFIYNSAKLNIEDERSVKDIFEQKFNKSNIVINAYDYSILGA